jgi:hypothetical protein
MKSHHGALPAKYTLFGTAPENFYGAMPWISTQNALA